MTVAIPRPRVPTAMALFRGIAVCVPLLVLTTRVDHPWPWWWLWTLLGWMAVVLSALWGRPRAMVTAALQSLALVLVVGSHDYSFSCPPPGELTLPFYAADNREHASHHVLASIVALVVAATIAMLGRRTSRSERLLYGAVGCVGLGLGAAELAAVEAALQVHPFVESRWSVGELADVAAASVHVAAFAVGGMLMASWLRAHEGPRSAWGARNAWRLIGAPFAFVLLVGTLRDPGYDLPRLVQPEGVDLPTAPAPQSHWADAREMRAQVVVVDEAGSSFGWNGGAWVPVHRWHRLASAPEEVRTLIYADRGAPLDALNATMEVVAAAPDVRLVMLGSHYPAAAHDRWAFTRLAEPRPIGVRVDYLPLNDDRLQECFMGSGNSCSPPYDLEGGLEYSALVGCPVDSLVFLAPMDDGERGRVTAGLGYRRRLRPPPPPTEPLVLEPQRVRFRTPPEAPAPSPWPAAFGALLALALAQWRTRRAVAVLGRYRPLSCPPRGRVAPPWLRPSEVAAGWSRTCAPYRGGGEVLAGPASIAEARASLRRQRRLALRRALVALGWLLAAALPIACTVRALSPCPKPSPAFLQLTTSSTSEAP